MIKSALYMDDLTRQIEDVKMWIKTFEREFVSEALNDFDEALERGDREDRMGEIVGEWYRIYKFLREVV